MHEWVNYLINISFIFILFNVMTYGYLIIKNVYSIRWFGYYIALAFFVQSLATILGKGFGLNNLPLLHFYSLLELIVLSIFYKKILENESWFQKAINYILVIGTILIIGNSIFVQSIYTFNSNAKTLSQIIIMGYAISYYFSILHKNTPTDSTLNLLNAAILLYYAGSFFIFMFSNVLSHQNSELLKLFFDFNILLYLIFQLLVLFAGWRKLYNITKS